MKINKIEKYINEELRNARKLLKKEYNLEKASLWNIVTWLERDGYDFLSILESLKILNLINENEKNKIIEYLAGENDTGEKYYDALIDIYDNEICRVFKKSI